ALATITSWSVRSRVSARVAVAFAADRARLPPSGSFRPAVSATTGVGVPAGVAPAPTRRSAGVPAALAHPCCSGPAAIHTPSRAMEATLAAIPPSRNGVKLGPARARRHTRAAITAATHTATIANAQGDLVSVPVPRVWITATGQLAYAKRCTTRHVLHPRRWRTRLVAVIAIRSSNATTPRPSQRGRYVAMNGTNASRKLSLAKGSMIDVRM